MSIKNLKGTARPVKSRKPNVVEAHRRAQDVSRGVEIARAEIGAFSFWRFWLRGFIFGSILTAIAAAVVVYFTR